MKDCPIFENIIVELTQYCMVQMLYVGMWWLSGDVGAHWGCGGSRGCGGSVG
jgi:hypothetical protein